MNSYDKIYVCSTTHPSLDVLKSQFMMDPDFTDVIGKIRFMTLHKLLGFKPYIENTTGERKFQSISGSKFLKQIEKRIVLIDECSMISTQMYKILNDNIRQYHVKTILMGDPAQLPPVSDSISHRGGINISPVFKIDPKYPHQICLTEIMRTGNIKLKKICNLFRSINLETSIIKQLKKFLPYDASFQVFKKSEMKWFDCFKKLTIDSKNINDIPIILTWTNHQADTYNRMIRKKLFNVKLNRYSINDLVVFKTYYQSPSNTCQKYYTATVIQIKEIINEKTPEIDWLTVKIDKKYRTFLKKLNKLTADFNVNRIFFTRVHTQFATLDDGEQQEILTVALESLEEYDNSVKLIMKNLTLFVEQCSQKTMDLLWDFYYTNIVNPYAQLIFGYSTTTHKSQSITRPIVFVDLADICLNYVTDEMKKCMYTSVSRVSHGLHLMV